MTIEFKSFQLALLAFSSLALAGCGSQYTVTKLDGPSVPMQLPDEGIYYSLPKTEVVVRIPVKRTITQHSPISYKFEENVKNCIAGKDIELAPSEVMKEHERGRVEVFTRALADPLHRYRLDVTAGTFSEFTHTIKVTEAGILTNADTTVKDAKTAFALATAKSLVGLVGAVAGLAVPGGAGAAPPTCDDILEAKAAADQIDQNAKTEISRIEAERDSLLLDKGLASEADTLAKAVSLLDGKVATVKKEAAKAKRALGVLPKKVEIVDLALFGRFAPTEFKQLDWAAGQDKVDLGPWQLLATSPKAKKDDKAPILPSVTGGTAREAVEVWAAKDLEELLRTWKLTVKIAPQITYKPCADGCPTPSGNGYRYRLPADGEVTITIDVTKAGGRETKLVAVRADVPVAQYGPIARLPSRFEGLEGNIALGLYSDFGTLKEVTVGANPQAADSAGNMIQLLTDTLTARRAAREAEAAEAAGAEKAELTARKDLLQLQVDILTLEKSLEELQATTDDTAN